MASLFFSMLPSQSCPLDTPHTLLQYATKYTTLIKEGAIFKKNEKEKKMKKEKTPFEKKWGTTPKEEIVRLSLAIVGTLSRVKFEILNQYVKILV